MTGARKKHPSFCVARKVRGGILWSGFQTGRNQASLDHILPARLIRRLKAGNSDRRENLQCICGTCHGYKLQADHKLCLGDKLRADVLAASDILVVLEFLGDSSFCSTVLLGPLRLSSRN